MDSTFHAGNRQGLYQWIGGDALVILFAGRAPRKSADSYYPYHANRNFAYFTGADDASAQGAIFMAELIAGSVRETMFLKRPDERAERWNGRRIKADEVRARCGIEHSKYLDEFEGALYAAVNSGKYRAVWLDLDRFPEDVFDTEAVRFAADFAKRFPQMRIENLLPKARALRTIKKPCEIDAMRRAMKVTREGILNMMKAARPGMYEYELKAIFDEALTRNGVLTPAFPPIISAGENNFCIHYDAYTGRVNDGDMILNDVGAQWDNLANDVSRGWPVNGVFDERQRKLYTCAYNTSEYMFSIIKPGMPMADVDLTARKYCFEQLKAIGLIDRYEDVGKYIWHGGAHHVGYDVHDVVDYERPVAPGMVFCVDIGIYCMEWGIGFRLEDNCLVTDGGCENLSREIPRSIEAIEAAMRKG